MPNQVSQIATPADAAAFYNGFGLAPAPAAPPPTDPGAYMVSPSSQAQVNDLYKGMYPIAQSASGTPTGQAYDPTSQQNFYNSAGISPAQVNQIGAPISAYVDQNGQRIVANPAATAAVGVAASADQGIDWSDPLWSAYRQGGDVAAQAELAAEQAAAVPAQPFPVASRLPIMGASAPVNQAPAATLHPIMAAAAAAPIAATNGFLYQPNSAGGYARVGTVPGVDPVQLYHSQATSILATQPNGDPNGNVGGYTTSGYNLFTGGQGGMRANNGADSGGSLSGGDGT